MMQIWLIIIQGSCRPHDTDQTFVQSLNQKSERKAPLEYFGMCGEKFLNLVLMKLDSEQELVTDCTNRI